MNPVIVEGNARLPGQEKSPYQPEPRIELVSVSLNGPQSLHSKKTRG